MSEFEFLAHLVNEANKKGGGTLSREEIDLKITFIDGGEIIVPDKQWDDYRYDGKFFTVVKDGADIAMYNASTVFSLVLVRHGD